MMKWKLVSYLVVLACITLQAAPVMAAGGTTDVSGSIPLVTYEVAASNISYYAATISWKTNGNATSQIFYDTASHDNVTGYAYNTVVDASLVLAHSVGLTGLASATTYHFRVKSSDTGDTAVSADYTFTTLSVPSGGGGGGGGGGAGAPVTLSQPGATGTNLVTQTNVILDSHGVSQTTGQIATTDGKVSLNVAAGTQLLNAQGQPLTQVLVSVPASVPPPPPQGAIVLTYDFGPAGATFVPPLTLTWSYDPNTLPTGVAEEALVIAYYDATTGKWVELQCVVDAANNKITASVSHFTTFAIIGTITPPEEEEVVPPAEEEEVVPPEEEEVVLPAPAAFSVSDLSISRLEVQPGETVTITVLVANTGGESGSYTLVLKLNGVKEAEETVTIAAGDSQSVSFTVAKEEAGSYSVVVDGLSGSFTVVLPVTPSGINWPLIGGIIGGVVVVGGLLGFFFLRRRRVA